MLATLILDFDGVIVESIPLKTVAFSKIFSFAPPKHLDEIIAFHLENGGMSRYDKFRHIYANILHEAPHPRDRRSGSRDEYVG
jgi:beta-phosphoglucomutase